VSFVARYSAVPRIALASAKESFGFWGLAMGSLDGECIERRSGALVDEADLAVSVPVGEEPDESGGVSVDISMLGQLG
jgi:hypothetical protein